MDFRLRRFAGSNPRLGQFDPAGMFGGGYQGFLYNFQDLTTLFTTPTRAANCALGDAIALVVNQNPNAPTAAILHGAAGTFLSTPSAAANQITGDIDLRILVSFSDLSIAHDLISKTSHATNYSYWIYKKAGGALNFGWSADGSTTGSKDSTAVPACVAGEFLWLRVTLDVDNGAGGHDVKFYTSTDTSQLDSALVTGWTQLGTTVTTAGSTSIYAGNATVLVGRDTDLNNVFTGAVRSAAIYNGINGTKAVEMRVTDYVSGPTFPSSTTGETWTLNGTAFIAPTDSAVQHTAASRPVLGCRPKVGKRNRLTYTEQINNAAWTKFETTVSANATTAPDGTSTADALIESANNTVHSLVQSPTLAVTATYILSVYLKANTRTWAVINFSDASNNRTWFDLTNGVVGTNAAGSTAAIESVGSGWYRCSVSRSFTLSPAAQVQIATGDNVSTYAGDGTSGIYVWGAQVEAGATVTAYQKVTEWYITTQADSPNVYFAAADGSNDYLTIPGSASSCKWLHDGTGAYMAGVWQAGIVPVPVVDYPLFDTTSGGTVVGYLIRWYQDDFDAFVHNGSALIINNIGADMLANTPTIATTSFATASTPDLTVYTPNETVTANATGTPSSANSGTDARIFGFSAGGGFALGTCDFLMAINRVPSIAEQGRLTQYLSDLTGVAA